MNREKPKRLDTTNVVLEFGMHKDSRIQRVPVSYLRFMVNNRTKQWEYAEAEMDRRGTVVPKIEVSGHAIDRASLHCRKIWHEHRDKEEGLHAWLTKEGWVAWNSRQSDRDDDSIHLGIRWIFEKDGAWPIVKTVMRAKERKR